MLGSQVLNPQWLADAMAHVLNCPRVVSSTRCHQENNSKHIKNTSKSIEKHQISFFLSAFASRQGHVAAAKRLREKGELEAAKSSRYLYMTGGVAHEMALEAKSSEKTY